MSNAMLEVDIFEEGKKMEHRWTEIGLLARGIQN